MKKYDIIYQGLIFDEQTKLIGKPDFLIKGLLVKQFMDKNISCKYEIDNDSFYVFDVKWKNVHHKANNQGYSKSINSFIKL